jgi:NADH:ubiquinone oxidoreductase subunit D
MATRKPTPGTAGRAPRTTKGEEPAAGAPAGQPAEARRPTMNTVTIPHVSRIEGHAKITIRIDDAGQVTDTQFHVTQVRGFEKFIEGRPYYEMPSITARICGIS